MSQETVNNILKLTGVPPGPIRQQIASKILDYIPPHVIKDARNVQEQIASIAKQKRKSRRSTKRKKSRRRTKGRSRTRKRRRASTKGR